MREEVFSAKIRRRMALGGLGIAFFMGSISHAFAASGPATKLVSCGEDSCLQVSGHRAAPDTPVRINGRLVAVEGGKSWKAVLPLRTVRIWSAPMARTIAVTVSEGEVPATQQADLPIGLLGHVTELASLVVSSR